MTVTRLFPNDDQSNQEIERKAEVFVAYAVDGHFCVSGDRQEAIDDLLEAYGHGTEFRVVRAMVPLPDFADEQVDL